MTSNALHLFVAVVALCVLQTTALAQADTTATPPPAQPAPTVEVETTLGPVTGKKIKESDGINYAQGMRDPRKATLLSAALPGLGQAYNHKYWKIPIVYAGFGVAGWFLRDNLQNISFYKEAYIAATDGNPETVNTTGLPPSQLLRVIDQYTQWRDLSVIAMFAIYILNIVDASVDAHLFYFDVSEDISMNFKPFWSPLMPTSPGLTLTLKL